METVRRIFSIGAKLAVWGLSLAGALFLTLFLVLNLTVYRDENACIRQCLADGGARDVCILSVCDRA